MKISDTRLTQNEISMLKNLVGEKLDNYQHQEFIFSNSISGVVKFVQEGHDYYLYCLTEPLNYLGTEEDVSKLSFEEKEYPFVAQKKLIKMPVGDIIKNILIVNENQKLFRNNDQIYDIWTTRGIIFEFKDYQISFEKYTWMMEEIVINRGINLIDKFTSTEDFVNDEWDEDITADCERMSITL